MKLINMFFLSLLGALAAGCSDSGSGSANGEHVWKEQTDTIQKAKEAEGKIMDAAKLQKNVIEEQSQ